MLDEINKLRKAAECLITPAEANRAYDQLAVELTDQLRYRNPLFLVVLTGGIIPAGKLISRLDFPLTLDYIHATRYQGGTSGGALKILARPTKTLKERLVVVVDDILDEGYTLAGIIDFCRSEGATEVLSAVLLDKQHARRFQAMRADFTGITVPDRYIFGEGADYHEYFRNLAGVYALRETEK